MKIFRLLARLLGKRQRPAPPKLLDLDKLMLRRFPGNAARRVSSRPVRGNAA